MLGGWHDDDEVAAKLLQIPVNFLINVENWLRLRGEERVTILPRGKHQKPGDDSASSSFTWGSGWFRVLWIFNKILPYILGSVSPSTFTFHPIANAASVGLDPLPTLEIQAVGSSIFRLQIFFFFFEVFNGKRRLDLTHVTYPRNISLQKFIAKFRKTVRYMYNSLVQLRLKVYIVKWILHPFLSNLLDEDNFTWGSQTLGISTTNPLPPTDKKKKKIRKNFIVILSLGSIENFAKSIPSFFFSFFFLQEFWWTIIDDTLIRISSKKKNWIFFYTVLKKFDH